MSTYMKCTLSVLVLFLVQLYGVLVEVYHFPAVLNHAWYTVAFWICFVLGCMGILMTIPMLGSTNTTDSEDRGIVDELGYEERSTWIHCKPFFVLTLAFVQLDQLMIAASCFGVWAFMASYMYTHRLTLRKLLIAEAEKGTNK